MKASGLQNVSTKSYTPYGVSTPERSTYHNSSPNTAGFSTSQLTNIQLKNMM